MTIGWAKSPVTQIFHGFTGDRCGPTNERRSLCSSVTVDDAAELIPNGDAMIGAACGLCVSLAEAKLTQRPARTILIIKGKQ